MQIAPVAMPRTDAVRTAITPCAEPFKAQITAVEDVADELTGETARSSRRGERAAT
jgi:hypothetical protein